MKASFFAGPQDTKAFRACKARGRSDKTCLKSGDNGVGLWGHDTTSTARPMFALPREVWKRAGKKGGARGAVTYKGTRVEGILGDTLPALLNIKNGVDIDLNPAYAVAFGIAPEKMNNYTLSNVSFEWL